jgi:hypothetical protein
VDLAASPAWSRAPFGLKKMMGQMDTSLWVPKKGRATPLLGLFMKKSIKTSIPKKIDCSQTSTLKLKLKIGTN